MLEDVKESVSSVLKERLVSPIFGSFVVSWVIWNLPLLYYIFTVDGEIPVETRWDCIKTIYGDENRLLWWPLWSSIGAMLLFPIFSGLVSLFRIWIDSLVTRFAFLIQKTTPISQDDAIALYERLDSIEKRKEILLQQKTSEIYALNDEMNTLRHNFEKEEYESSKRHKKEIAEKETSYRQQIIDLEERHKLLHQNRRALEDENEELKEKVSSNSLELTDLNKKISFIIDKVLPEIPTYYRQHLNKIKSKGALFTVFKVLDQTMGVTTGFIKVPEEMLVNGYLNEVQELENNGYITLKASHPEGSKVDLADVSFSFTKLGEELRIFDILDSHANKNL